MSEDVYVNTGPDHLTKKVRYGRGEMEMEQREEIEDIYLTPDDHIYATADDLVLGAQQDAAQNNTAQEHYGGGEESKQNHHTGIAVAVCVGLSCLLLLTGIIVLLMYYCALIKGEKNLQLSFNDLLTRLNNLTEQRDQRKTRLDELQTRLNNLTEQRDQCKTRLDELQTRHSNLTEQRDQCKTSFNDLLTRHSNLTEQRDQCKTSFNDLLTRLNNLTEQRDQCKTRLDELQTRHSNLIEQDDIKKTLCESHGFTFGGGICYYISTEKKTCEESRTYCRDNQSDLIIITSQDKQEFVDSIVGRGLERAVWLGLTDRDKEAVWEWVDGTPLTTPTYWQPGEPNDYEAVGGEDCAVFVNGQWDDRSCSVDWRWICEKAI